MPSIANHEGHLLSRISEPDAIRIEEDESLEPQEDEEHIEVRAAGVTLVTRSVGRRIFADPRLGRGQ